MAGEWLTVTQFAAAGLMLALAGWLCWLDFRSRAVRAFATFLVLWAAVTISLRAAPLVDARTSAAMIRASTYYLIGAIAAMVYLASVHPRPRGPFATRAGFASLVAFVAVSWLALAADPCLALCEGIGSGPLIAVAGAGPLVAASLSWLFVRDALAARGHERASLLLIAAGFLAHGIVTVGLLGGTWLLDPRGMAAATTGPWGVIAAVLDLAPIIPSFGAVIALRKDVQEHANARRFLGLLLLGLGVGLAGAIAPRLLPAPTAPLFFLGLWRLVLPLLAGYALMRYRLFGIDVRARKIIDRATLAAFFAAAFFIVSETVASYLGPRIGTFAGILAAGLLLLAIAPLERVASRLVTGALGPRPAPLDEERRRELYRAMARRAWQNGSLDARERRFLDEVRVRLEIPIEETSRIESDTIERIAPRS